MNDTPKKVSDLGAMKALEKGQNKTFAIKSLTTIRAYASMLNAMRGTKSLTTKIDRNAGTITVFRIA